MKKLLQTFLHFNNNKTIICRTYNNYNYQKNNFRLYNWCKNNSKTILISDYFNKINPTKLNRQIYYNNTINYSSSSSSSSSSSISSSWAGANNSYNIKMTNNKSSFERLPNNVIPKHYILELKPNLVDFTFEGTVDIEIEIKSLTKEIVLNSRDLKIDEDVTLTICNNDSTTIIKTKDIQFTVDQEIVTLKFENDLPIGNGKLNLKFVGELNDKMEGFYRSKYINAETDEERFGAVTQFESTDARRCFPCFDEPAIKSTFDIALIVPKNRVALSNMPIISDEIIENEPTLKLVKFDKTPIMSTYLVAVVVGEYDYVEDHSADGVHVRVFTPVGKKEQGNFALHVATKVLPYYKDYFNIAYPLPKIDLIAIADFSAGAMENWGLITYRESCLLVDPENTSLIRKQSIALTVGHEMAHQWFGNLVTMEWWTYLWLNEGYASFVEYLCVDHLFPEYDIWTQFVTDTYIRALELDCLKNSHPVEVIVSHPDEIVEIFDEISYNKGASIIRMLHNFIGDADFRKGMHIYLTRYQYNNTRTEDLWSALEEASNKPVGKIMSSWIKIMGFPVVNVQSEQIANKRILTLSQEKFTADGGVSCVNGVHNTDLWSIPIIITKANSDERKSIILDQKTTQIEIENVSENDWIKLNPGVIGYYRTRYPYDMLDRFIPIIKNQTLPPLDRLGLLDDSMALVQAGCAPTVDVLKLIDAFRNETNYTVWSAISNSLAKLKQLLSHTNVLAEFNLYCTRLYKPVIDVHLGWEAKSTDKHMDTLLRVAALSQLITYGCPEILTEGIRRFNCHVTSECILPADLRSVCYRAAAQNGDLHTYEQMLKLYRSADLNEEKDRIARAMGNFKKLDILKKVIEFSVEAEVRSQDSVFIIASVSLNPIGRDMAWEFFKSNYKKLSDKFPGTLLARIVKILTENFVTEERAIEVEQFFKENHCPAAERSIQQSIETIKLNAAWLNRDLRTITEYLTNTVK